jgi:hypothetical protein
MAQAVPQTCKEASRLREAYVTALHELIGATTILQRAEHGPEMAGALEKTRQARYSHDDARHLYEVHRKTHGCQPGPRSEPPRTDPYAPVLAPLKPKPRLGAAKVALLEPDEVETVDEPRYPLYPPRRPPKLQRAGAALKIPWHVADAIGRALKQSRQPFGAA